MSNVSRARLTIPKAAAGEIPRKELVAAILDNQKGIAYIHAGAGFGKTTLLSQVANSIENTVWITLDGESDIFSFIDILAEALRQIFPGYDFTASEYLIFEGKNNFITIIANALISSMERLTKNFMLVLDDLHSIEDQQIRELIACLIKYKPENVRVCLSSRETPWLELVPLCVRGRIFVLAQRELAFTRDETTQALGFDDADIYNLTEGWPLAIGSFKVLLENGVSIADVPAHGNEALYAYLFYECVSRLPSEMVDFLKASACFEELDPQMLNSLSGKKNAKLLLDSLVARNIFTIKTGGGHYRYHTLFRAYLLEGTGDRQVLALQHKAAGYYFDNKQYSKAAEYAVRLDNKEMLEQIVLITYKDHLKKGSFSELRVWFNALGDSDASLSRELLVAKGVFLSSIGNFNGAKTCLDTAIPLLGKNDKRLYIEAMVHKARVARNFSSFEESNSLLDELLSSSPGLSPDILYSIVIEKLYNLCWNSQVTEAYELTHHMIDECAKAGDLRVKSWFERYLVTVHFYAGRAKDAVYYYEKSLELTESDMQYLDMHCVGMYAAKAYQALGDQNKATSLISAELQKLRSTGRYEEMWAAYLLAAEIHYHIAFVDRMNGGSQSYDTAIKYFTLAEEYALLYRTTRHQILWSKMLRLICSLTFESVEKEPVINEILAHLDQVNDYQKILALSRLFGYYAAVSDFQNAMKYAKLAVEVGERSDIMLTPAYATLVRAALAMNEHSQAVQLTGRYLRLCFRNGIYDFFKIRNTYGLILEFALANSIEPDITKQMMEFAGYKIKKIYITTLGGFSVFPYKDRREPIKMRTKKERELLAFLLDAGSEGVTKEQIYEALWYESNSDDVKKLIGVNLAHIKKDLAGLGVENSIVNFEKHYSICKDEIVADIDLFEAAAQEFELQKSDKAAQKLLSLYKGEYLSDFEALWAVGKRIKYRELFKKALAFVGN